MRVVDVHSLEHRDLQAFFATEVVVEHPLVRVGGASNRINPRTSEPMSGELVGGSRKNPLACAFGIALNWMWSRLAHAFSPALAK
jgi:hypothetical protein